MISATVVFTNVKMINVASILLCEHLDHGRQKLSVGLFNLKLNTPALVFTFRGNEKRWLLS